MVQITINKDKCVACGKCVGICPADIFYKGEKGEILLQKEEACIGCGHCVSVCPHDAITHSLFPADKQQSFSYEDYPTPESLMTLIKARRSNRAMAKKPIPEEMLKMIVEAAYLAPTATNSQNLEFTLITDIDKIRKVTSFTISTFYKIRKMLANKVVAPITKLLMPKAFAMVPMLDRLKAEFEKGNDKVMRNATAMLIISAPKGDRFGAENANLSYQNASLMAESLGVAQFYTGFVLTATRLNKGALEKELGIKGTICAGMALGMPQFKYVKYPIRKDIDFSQI